MHISDMGEQSASEQLHRNGRYGCAGMTQAEVGIGLSMFPVRLASAENDRMASIHWLAEYAKKNAPRSVIRKRRQEISLHADHRQVCILRLPHQLPIPRTGTKCAGSGKKVKMVEKSHYTNEITAI